MSTDLAVRDTDSWTTVLEPARVLATDIANTEFVPTAMRGNPHKVLACILRARELGIPPMTGMASLDVIEGKPTLTAAAMRGLIFAAGHELRVVESGNQRCTVKARRREDRGDPDGWQSFSYTDQEAKQAGLLGKKNWTTYRQDMLLARATTRMARAVFPDVIMGLDTAEVMADGATAEIMVTPVVEPPPAMQTVAKPAARRKVREQQAKPSLSLADIEDDSPRGPVVSADDVVDAVIVDEQPSSEEPSIPVEQSSSEQPGTPVEQISADQVKAYHTLLGVVHMDRAEGLQFAADVTGRTDLTSSKDLTMPEASRVLDALTQLEAEQTTPPAMSVKSQWDHIIGMANQLGLLKPDALALYSRVTGRDVTGTKDLTMEEARRVIIELQHLSNGPLIGSDES